MQERKQQLQQFLAWFLAFIYLSAAEYLLYNKYQINFSGILKDIFLIPCYFDI